MNNSPTSLGKTSQRLAALAPLFGMFSGSGGPLSSRFTIVDGVVTLAGAAPAAPSRRAPPAAVASGSAPLLTLALSPPASARRFSCCYGSSIPYYVASTTPVGQRMVCRLELHEASPISRAVSPSALTFHHYLCLFMCIYTLLVSMSCIPFPTPRSGDCCIRWCGRSYSRPCRAPRVHQINTRIR